MSGEGLAYSSSDSTTISATVLWNINGKRSAGLLPGLLPPDFSTLTLSPESNAFPQAHFENPASMPIKLISCLSFSLPLCCNVVGRGLAQLHRLQVLI